MTVIGTWQEKAAAKRNQRDASIPTEWKIDTSKFQGLTDVTHIPAKYLDNLEVEITQNNTVNSLIDKLGSGKYSCEQVTRAFCKRACIAHQLLNCCTEFIFDKAIEDAKKLDEYFKKTGKPIGPLHGLPISLKDQVNVKGVEMTLCYVEGIGNISQYDAVIVEILRSQGAIFYVKTMMPQAIMFQESWNNIFGRVSNPFNRNLSSGGSSGGEGALLGIRGSIIGVGTDISGSIRGPSCYQGLYGLRASYQRIPIAKVTGTMQGQEMIPSVIGPMSTSIDGLKTFVKAISDGKPWEKDPYVTRSAWNESLYRLADHGGDKDGKLCFGILLDDGICKPVEPVRRALEMVRRALEAKGHKVIEYKPHLVSEAIDLVWKIFDSDGGKDIKLSLDKSGEPRLGYTDEQMKTLQEKHMKVYDYWQLGRAREKVAREILEHWQNTVSRTNTGRPIDALICPTVAYCAPLHNTASPNSPSKYSGYSSIWSLVDYVCAAIPVTRVDKELDVKQERTEFHGSVDKNVYERYDAEKFENSPIGVQCVGQKNEEEAIIRMAEIIDEALKETAA